jgi:hypothetical protein
MDLVLVEKELSSIPDSFVASHAAAKTINLTGNAIRPPANLDKFKEAEALILDLNELDSLEGFPVMPSVTTLWLNKNKFNDLPSLVDQIKASFPNCQVLSLMGNPCAPGLVLTSQEDVMRIERYRGYLAHRLSPHLAVLDSSRITDKERADGKAAGDLAIPRKPPRPSAAAAAAAASSAAPTVAEPSVSPSEGSSSGRSAKGNAFLALGRSNAYDGSHSEGNRFIVDTQL